MKQEKNQIDELNAELTLTIEKDDYLGEYNKQIKSYQAKAQMKGFRKGKTPVSVIKKMYGASVMQESVSKVLTDKINDLITGDEFNIIGEPYLIDRENLPELDHKNPADYTYKFELGLEPEFEVSGITESDTYPRLEVLVGPEMIEEELLSLQKRLGTQDEVEDTVKEGDVIYFTGKELYNDKVLLNGRSSDFTMSYEKVNAQYKDQLTKMAKGDTIDVDIYQFEEGMPSDSVEKYLLGIKDDESIEGMGSEFRCEITKVVRATPAELNQDAFDKSFGKDEVKSKEEAEAKIKEFLEDYFKAESDKLVNREIMHSLMDKHNVALPESFLKKWMNQDPEKEPMTDEQFDSFKKELKWRIIKKKLVKRFEVEVKEEEIFQYFVNAIKSYSPYIDEASLKNSAFSLMQNREQVNTAVETISSGKLFDAIREVVKTESEFIDKDGFYEKVKSMNENV